MPIYEYQCQACGHQMEALQKISDDPLQDCPVCHQSSLQKLVSAASFRLKGGGWYETDFKSGDKKHLADSDSVEKSESGTDAKDRSGKDKGKEMDAARKDSGKSDKGNKSAAADSKSTGNTKPSGKDPGKAKN